MASPKGSTEGGWYADEQAGFGLDLTSIPAPATAGVGKVRLMRARAPRMTLPARSQTLIKPAGSSRFVSRIPFAFSLLLLAGIAYISYAAASRSLSAFQSSWDRTDTLALQSQAQ